MGSQKLNTDTMTTLQTTILIRDNQPTAHSKQEPDSYLICSFMLFQEAYALAHVLDTPAPKRRSSRIRLIVQSRHKVSKAAEYQKTIIVWNFATES